MNEKKKVYHYLHESAAGSVEAEWQDSKSGHSKFKLVLKLPIHTGVEQEYGFYSRLIDPRDQRTLVAFDGNIPPGGLPKGGSIIDFAEARELSVLKQSVREPRTGEEANNQLYFREYPFAGSVDGEKKEFACVIIRRYFLLLPKSRSLVRKYRDDSLSPIYVMIEVNEKGVTWRTSSY